MTQSKVKNQGKGESTPTFITRRVPIKNYPKIKDPTYALTHLLKKPLNLDAVKLSNESQE